MNVRFSLDTNIVIRLFKSDPIITKTLVTVSTFCLPMRNNFYIGCSLQRAEYTTKQYQIDHPKTLGKGTDSQAQDVKIFIRYKPLPGMQREGPYHYCPPQ